MSLGKRERDPAVSDDAAHRPVLDAVATADLGDFLDESRRDGSAGHPGHARTIRTTNAARGRATDQSAHRIRAVERDRSRRAATWEPRSSAVAAPQNRAATDLPPSTILIGRPIGDIISFEVSTFKV